MSASELFDKLARPKARSDELSAARISKLIETRVAKDAEGQPSFLIPTKGRQGQPVSLQHLRVLHGARCRVRDERGTAKEGSFTLITFVGDDPALRELFLHSVDAIVWNLGARPTPTQVDDAIEQLVELFAALAQPPRKAVQGLWAELFLVVHARRPLQLLRAWHAEFDDRYDFNAGDERIEVKSCLGRGRKHRFSMAQLDPPEGTALTIVSICMESAGGGLSMRSLIEGIRNIARADPTLLTRVDRNLVRTLGNSYAQALAVTFDAELARQTLMFIEAKDVPRIRGRQPAGVSEINFVADLSECKATTRSIRASLLDAARPRRLG